MIAYSDTLWYGGDHFSLCRHVEGMHAVIRYRPAVSKDYAGDWLSIELRDELPSRASTPSRESAAITAAGSRPYQIRLGIVHDRFDGHENDCPRIRRGGLRV